MDASTLSIVSVIAFMAPCMFLGIQIGIVMGLAGVLGIWVFTGNPMIGLGLPFMRSYSVASWYTLMVIPLFVALGAAAGEARITSHLFRAFFRWVGHIPGGIATATIGTCAGFAAISGSSMATSAAMSKFAAPELSRYGYDRRLSLGAIAMGGTLSIIIPPSVTLVLFAIIAEQSVGKQLVAGIVPGMILAVGYAAKIYIRCRLNPELGPRGPHFSWHERFDSLLPVIPFACVIAAIIGGIMFGIWTPVEAAAVGLLLIIALGFFSRELKVKALFGALTDAVVVSASIMIIVIGSLIFSNYLALTGINAMLVEQVEALELSPFHLYVMFVVIYIILGMFMEAASILALTVPLAMPIITAVGWDPIWFGVVVVLLMEIAAVTPPVGLNLFVVKAAVPGAELSDVVIGSIPFFMVNFIILFVLYFFPDIATWLPSFL